MFRTYLRGDDLDVSHDNFMQGIDFNQQDFRWMLKRTRFGPAQVGKNISDLQTAARQIEREFFGFDASCESETHHGDFDTLRMLLGDRQSCAVSMFVV